MRRKPLTTVDEAIAFLAARTSKVEFTAKDEFTGSPIVHVVWYDGRGHHEANETTLLEAANLTRGCR